MSFRAIALIVAMAAQLFAPTAVSALASDPDGATFICAPTGNASPGAAAAIEELLQLAGGAPDEHPAGHDHCEACLAAPAIPSRTPIVTLIENTLATSRPIARALVPPSYSVHGPPLGLRAPPHTYNP